MQLAVPEQFVDRRYLLALRHIFATKRFGKIIAGQQRGEIVAVGSRDFLVVGDDLDDPFKIPAGFRPDVFVQLCDQLGRGRSTWRSDNASHKRLDRRMELCDQIIDLAA